jgi:hypothetical protein
MDVAENRHVLVASGEDKKAEQGNVSVEDTFFLP